MKTTSKTAVAVAAGMLFSLSSAYAADLGGNCCNDLEERVAELEATAARKGTRNVSLTISGQVNRLIMNYSDGGTNVPSTALAPGNLASNTFWGIDNVNSSSRFNLTGNGKIDATRKAGYNITVEIASGARSTSVNQSRAEAAAVATTAPGYSQFGLNDQALAVRDANVWIEDSRLGRLTLGRLTPSGAQGTIDLGGIGVIAPSTSLVGSGLGFRNAANGLVSSIAASYDANGNLNNRSDGIRYETPTYQGFQAAFTFAEASNQVGFVTPVATNVPLVVNGALNSGNGDLGQVWAANLRYANEFNGVRVAAAIGYERNSEDSQSSPAGVDKRHLGFSGSLMHVATGLFVQGSYTKISTTEASFVPDVTRDGGVFHIAGGVSKNWFGVGNTSLYGEYGAGDDMFFVHRVGGAVAGDGGKFWGLGVVQNVNSANLELYAGYRNHSATLAAQGPLKDVNILATGMRIKF